MKTRNRTARAVTGEDIISEVLAHYPEAAEVLSEAGMQCLGCFSAGYETVREACHTHGLDPVEILEKLNSRPEQAGT